MEAWHEYCPPCEVTSGLNSRETVYSVSDILTPFVAMGSPLASIQDRLVVALSTRPLIVKAVQISVYAPPTVEVPSVVIENVGIGKAVWEEHTI